MTATKLIAPLTVDHGQINTVISAERAIIRAAVDLRWYGPDHGFANQWSRDMEALTLAISATTGEPTAEILIRLDKSIDRAFARQERESAAMARKLGLK